MIHSSFVNFEKIIESMEGFRDRQPFHHAVVDEFLTEDALKHIEDEFLDFHSPKWYTYKNAIEDKKALNDWNAFPAFTYQFFAYLNSTEFVSALSELVGTKLYSDLGLHGGGWHIHGSGGNLNPHLDYSIHPKMGLQRRLNIIVYVSRELQAEHGGHLGLWEHDAGTNQPGRLIKEVQPKLNRAVIFDTTQNSWHGMSRPLIQPDDIYRKSLAIYYLCVPEKNALKQQRALFAPRESQKDDKEVRELIQKRVDVIHSMEVYRDETKQS